MWPCAHCLGCKELAAHHPPNHSGGNTQHPGEVQMVRVKAFCAKGPMSPCLHRVQAMLQAQLLPFLKQLGVGTSGCPTSTVPATMTPFDRSAGQKHWESWQLTAQFMAGQRLCLSPLSTHFVARLSVQSKFKAAASEATLQHPKLVQTQNRATQSRNV